MYLPIAHKHFCPFNEGLIASCVYCVMGHLINFLFEAFGKVAVIETTIDRLQSIEMTKKVSGIREAQLDSGYLFTVFVCKKNLRNSMVQ